VLKAFVVDLPTYRTGVQIAMFSLAMPLAAISPNFWAFVAAYALVWFSLNGESAIGSRLVAETWPARLRGTGGWYRGVYRQQLGLACRLHSADGDRANRHLCEADVSGIALPGAHPGPQESHLVQASTGTFAQRRGCRLGRRSRQGWHPPVVPA
jgi:hypothetical protein